MVIELNRFFLNYLFLRASGDDHARSKYPNAVVPDYTSIPVLIENLTYLG